MQKKITLKLLPSEAANAHTIRDYIAKTEAIQPDQISGYFPVKRSIDARGKQAWINLTLHVFIDEPFTDRPPAQFRFADVSRANHQVIIVGAGPAGLFAALQLIEDGIKPIIIERGKDVRARRRDLALLNKTGEVNPESNYCFGEGGAGTYSDGKLYTRSSKRGDINRILQLFVYFGADEKILYEAHPHIGTNKLPHIITAMREQIVACGGIVAFEQRVDDLIIDRDILKGVITSTGDSYRGDAVILATGHSARDIFELFYRRNISIEAKSFALGIRVEHPQSIIDSSQYHAPVRDIHLPPASYSWVQQVDDKGVFSFCMCPGGIIAPAATSPGELVVNGWSPSKRNNPFANSGIVVTVESRDALQYFKNNSSTHHIKDDALLLMHFQQAIERKAFKEGGGKFVAPAQRLVDFTNDKLSADLPSCSYLPGIASRQLSTVLPAFVHERLKQAFRAYGSRMRGYLTNDAVVVATESRTSSPVRIPRDATSLQHPDVKNLYPCGEGAGYAGGIVSAAMDGERVAKMIGQVLQTRS